MNRKEHLMYKPETDTGNRRGNRAASWLVTAMLICVLPLAAQAEFSNYPTDTFPSTYVPGAAPSTAIINATILTGSGELLENATLLMEAGRISAVGQDIALPEGVEVFDGNGMWVTPGIIDAHSHLGVYASPGHLSMSDGNEMTDPVTPGIWAEHSVNPQDVGFSRALAGGVTTIQVLPGSANLFGGRTVVLKLVPRSSVQEMKFPGALQGLKMACGENPKRVYKSRGPSTRMGMMAGYRQAFSQAAEYRDSWARYQEAVDNGENPVAPKRDLDMDTLAAVLDGDIIVNIHCYRGDEMIAMLGLAEEFGFKIRTFHHAIEAYKIAPELAQADVCVATWADWWGYKLEAFDTVESNAAIIHEAGGCAIIKSDSDTDIQVMNQMMTKAWSAGKRGGLHVSKEDAIQWITLNPAKALGIENETGSLEAGKAADVVLWSADPFSVYALAEKVFVDGSLEFDRSRLEESWQGDFETWYNKKGAHQ